MLHSTCFVSCILCPTPGTIGSGTHGEERLTRISAHGQARLQLPDGREYSYLRLHYFASETTRAVEAALHKGEVDGVDGYILDLRNNPGARCHWSG
jgi:Peptidase family S41